MKLIVQKYGGTSVADASAIKKAASKVIKTKEEGNSVVVVVSAMGSRTDDLINLAVELTDDPAPREMDMLLSTGERETMSLMAMYLNSREDPERDMLWTQLLSYFVCLFPQPKDESFSASDS